MLPRQVCNASQGMAIGSVQTLMLIVTTYHGRTYDDSLVKIDYLPLSQDLDIIGSEPNFRRALWLLGTTPENDQPVYFRNYRDWFFPEYDEVPLFPRLSIARLMAVVIMQIPTIKGGIPRFALSHDGDVTPEMVAASASEQLSIVHKFTVSLATSSLWSKAGDGNMDDIELTLKDLGHRFNRSTSPRASNVSQIIDMVRRFMARQFATSE